jgi:hypothetical protein
MVPTIDCGLGCSSPNGKDNATSQIVKPPSRFHIPKEGDNLYDDQGQLIAKMATYIFKCDHLFCDDCLTGHKAACDSWTVDETELTVDGVTAKIPAYTKAIPMACPLCKAVDINTPDEQPTAAGATHGAPKKWSKKTIAKVALAALAILAALAAILLVVILV